MVRSTPFVVNYATKVHYTELAGVMLRTCIESKCLFNY